MSLSTRYSVMSFIINRFFTHCHFQHTSQSCHAIDTIRSHVTVAVWPLIISPVSAYVGTFYHNPYVRVSSTCREHESFQLCLCVCLSVITSSCFLYFMCVFSLLFLHVCLSSSLYIYLSVYVYILLTFFFALGPVWWTIWIRQEASRKFPSVHNGSPAFYGRIRRQPYIFPQFSALILEGTSAVCAEWSGSGRAGDITHLFSDIHFPASPPPTPHFFTHRWSKVQSTAVAALFCEIVRVTRLSDTVSTEAILSTRVATILNVAHLAYTLWKVIYCP